MMLSVPRSRLPRLSRLPHLVQQCMAGACQFVSSAAVAPTKPSVPLLAQIRRQLEDVPMSLAKQSLVECDNDYDAAIAWLQRHATESGAAHAAKLADRTATDGLIALVRFPSGAAMVEVNCETDFVARTTLFKQLAHRCALTAHLHALPSDHSIHTVPLDTIANAPVVPEPDTTSIVNRVQQEPPLTVAQLIVQCIGKLGENITLRRIVTAATSDPSRFVTGVYVHGDKAHRDAGLGRIGAIVTLSGNSLSPAHAKLAQQIAQIVVGYNPPTQSLLLATPFTSTTPFLTTDCANDVTAAKVLQAAQVHLHNYTRFQLGEKC